MKLTKNSGRLLGFFFLASAIAGGTGTALRGFTGVEANTTDFLNHVLENISQMKLAIYTDMIASAIAVGIAIFMFPFIKKFSHRLAITYFGISLVNFVIITVSNIIHIALLSVSTEFSATTATEPAHYTTLAKMLYDSYYWTHFLMLMLYSIGGSVLFFFLFKTQLAPKWLAVWGIIASTIVFVGGALQIAGITVSFLLFVQNGLFMLTFIFWLLIAGFKTTKFLDMKARDADLY